MLKQKGGENRGFRGKVKNSFWACQILTELSHFRENSLTKHWHKQCFQGKKVACEIHEPITC